MPSAHVSTVDLEWESFGEGRPLLLVMGIGSQGILWPVGFCEALAARGFRVIRFDHRDVGRSSRQDQLGRPPVARVALRALLRRPTGAPYGLEDMADDTIGLLDALGLPDAHVVGASMGGMIAQLAAIRHPRRVRSLVSIMSTTGRRRDLVGDPRAALVLLRRPAPGREGFVEHFVAVLRALYGPEEPDEAELTALAEQVWDRGAQSADAWARHLAAILGARDRRADLARLEVPTLVLHGTADPLVPIRAGRATARAIPGARFVAIEGMGHSLPRPRWPDLVAAIAQHADRADGR